jgi:APA family basic amino acid/polyamine antiporter
MPSENSSPDLRRELTLLDSTMINVGTMIASAIFIVPSTIALHVQSSGLSIFVWIAAGMVSLLGALAIAELGAALPHAGGQFVYLREAYGPIWGFLYGWAAFAVINSASIAAIAVGFATYLGFFVQLSPNEIKAVAIGSIIFLTIVNCFGLKLSAWTQNVFTLLKIGALLALVVTSFVLRGGSLTNFSPVLPDQSFASLIGPFGLAMVAALWAYDGWIEITYVAGEVKNPQRNLPLSIIFSTLIVIVIYVFVNLAYHYALPLAKIAQSPLVGSDAATVLIGPAGAALVVLGILISTMGSNHAIVLTAPRIYYAMAKERLFFSWVAQVHPKFHSPVLSLISQGIWSCLITLTGTYDQLLTYVVFASFVFYAMSCGAVIILRQKSTSMARPYKTWGYPLTPVVFILFSLGLVINTIVEKPREAAIGAGIILLGLPAYFYWKRKM